MGHAPLIQVFDMAVSLHFYCDVLGFRLISASAQSPPLDWVLLRLDNTEIMLQTAYEGDNRPATPDPARVAGHADASFYFGCPDIDAAYAHLLAQGLPAKEPKIAPYGMRQLYVTDPDGFELCFQWPAAKHAIDQWKEWYGFDAEKK